jgi:hypothetical protein
MSRSIGDWASVDCGLLIALHKIEDEEQRRNILQFEKGVI